MSQYMDALRFISTPGESTQETPDQNGDKATQDNGVATGDDTDNVVVDEKELQEQVEDLMEIRNKEMLKRNLMNVLRENLELKARVEKLKAQLAKVGTACQAVNQAFQIDTCGADDEEESSNNIVYQQSKILMHEPEEKKDNEKEKAKSSMSCFNCLGDHMIQDCPIPKNPREIAKNRKEFMSKKSILNAPRYHVDEPQRFGHLSPGLPSQKLREALRLRENQVPEYIYRMRQLGYPPGWMKHAEISHSGLNLYHHKDKRLMEDGEEEGEVAEEGDKVQYDIEKLVEWPGFNAPLPRQFRDETDKYRVPSLSKCQQLKDMKKELQPKKQKGYVRGKMQNTSTAALNSTIELSGDDDEDMDTQDPEEDEGDVESPQAAENLSDVPKTPSSSARTPSSCSVSKTEPGTPIVELYSPYEKLPDQNKFSKDVSEHILFDNLPDSTGKWEEMSGLISRIRKRKAIQDKEGEDD